MSVGLVFLSLQGASAGAFLSPEHGSNTNRIVGGECGGVCACVQGVCPLLCVIPAVTSAGAYDKLDSVCVIEILYNVISTSSGFYHRGLFDAACPCVFVAVEKRRMSMCVLQVLRGYCSSRGSLRDHPLNTLAADGKKTHKDNM